MLLSQIHLSVTEGEDYVVTDDDIDVVFEVDVVPDDDIDVVFEVDVVPDDDVIVSDNHMSLSSMMLLL
jgi:hypothetical protein